MSTAWISQTRETIPFEQSSQFTCRNWGVDLLRILSMFMVVVLHVLGQGGILVAQVPFDYGWVLCWTLESACFCAVNCFGTRALHLCDATYCCSLWQLVHVEQTG